MQDSEQTEKYLYCIIRSSEPRTFSSRGIGEQNTGVYTINAGNLAAVVSESTGDRYKQNRRNLMAHTVVQEEAMNHFTILPMRFGTVAPNVKAIQKFLTHRADEIERLLNQMEGRSERGLKAFWYEGAIFQEIVNENTTIRELRDSLAGRSQQETYYDSIKLGEMVESAMQQKREQDSEQILSRLRPLALQVKENSAVSDRMVLNAAFLIENQHSDAFDQAIERLDNEMGKRLIFKYISLAPPYNFVSMSIGWNTEQE